MPREWSRLASALFAACLLHAMATGSPAQTLNKKSSTIRPSRAEDDPVDAPAPRPRAKPPSAQQAAPSPSTAMKARNTRPTPEAEDEPEETDGESPEHLERPLLHVPRLDPEMERVLIEWETHSSRFKRVAGAFSRRRYNNVFCAEYWAEGRFVYQAPDKGYYELNGVNPSPNAKPKRNKDGKPYDRKPEESEKWVCTGTSVFKINDKEKTYEKFDIPEEHQGQNIIDGPLPFLFGMKADQAKRRYVLQLMEPNRHYPNDHQIKVLPRRRDDAANWSEATVILDSERFLPRAVILTPPGDSETVHIFGPIDINDGGGMAEWFKGDPFKPKIKNYKRIDIEASGPPPGDVGLPPRGNTQLPKSGAQPGRATSHDRRDRDPPKSAEAPRKKPAAR